MDPFMLQISKVVHDERVQTAADLRHVRQTGTRRSTLLERALANVGEALASQGPKSKTHSRPESATSTSQLS